MKECLLTVIVGAMALLAGCGDKECFVVTRDAHGIRKDAPVVWRDAYVGAVSAVETAAEGTRISLDVRKPFDGQIRAGVSARIVNDANIHSGPFVLLVGGRDESMPLLEGGVQIPEARTTDELKDQAAGFLGWWRGSSHLGEKAGGGILLVLLIVLRFVKRMVKLLIKLLILATIAIVVLVTRNDWKEYQQRAESALSGAREIGNWTMEHAGKVKAALDAVGK